MMEPIMKLIASVIHEQMPGFFRNPVIPAEIYKARGKPFKFTMEDGVRFEAFLESFELYPWWGDLIYVFHVIGNDMRVEVSAL